MQIIKKSESSNWNEASNDTSEAVSNATYAIKQYLNINDFDSPGELETYLKAFTSNDEEITTTNTWKEVYQNWIKMDKFSVGLVDIYAINESKAPTGYEKNNNTIYLKVKKKINNGYYCIDYVAFLNTATGEELSADGIYLKSKEIDGMTYLIHEGWNIKVAYKSGSENACIFITETNPPINSYNIKLVKKSTNDSFSGNTTLGGAEFQVKQYKNNAETKIDPSKSDSQCNHITNPASDSIVKFIKNDYNDGNGNVLMYKNEAGKIDKYLIRETKSPQYYNKSKFFSENENNYILIETVKAESGNKVIIDHINVYAYRYTQSGYVKEKITNFENAIEKGSSAQSEGDYNIYVGLNSAGTEIIVYEKNSPVPGNYDLNIGKKSTENYKNNNDSDYLSGVQYSVNLYANKTGDIIEKAKSNNVKIDSYLENYYKNNKKD